MNSSIISTTRQENRQSERSQNILRYFIIGNGVRNDLDTYRLLFMNSNSMPEGRQHECYWRPLLTSEVKRPLADHSVGLLRAFGRECWEVKVNQTRDGESAEVERLSIVEGIDARVTEDPSLSAEQQEYLRNRWLHEVNSFPSATRRSRRTYYLLGIV